MTALRAIKEILIEMFVNVNNEILIRRLFASSQQRGNPILICNVSVGASSHLYLINIKLLYSVFYSQWEPTSSHQVSQSPQKALSISDKVMRTNFLHAPT